MKDIVWKAYTYRAATQLLKNNFFLKSILECTFWNKSLSRFNKKVIFGLVIECIYIYLSMYSNTMFLFTIYKNLNCIKVYCSFSHLISVALKFPFWIKNKNNIIIAKQGSTPSKIISQWDYLKRKIKFWVSHPLPSISR